ncbi:MAG: hypothetical protein AAF495_05515 [Pseudomonadota bacterium]
MDFERLSRFELAKGNHARPSDGLCVMEAVAWFEGELHGDHPACVCPVIGHYARALNDRLGPRRQDLVPYIPRLVNTREGPAVVGARLEILLARYLAIGGSRRIAQSLWDRLAHGKLPVGTTSFALDMVSEGIVLKLPADQSLALLDGLLAEGRPSPGFSGDLAQRALALEAARAR